MMKAYGSAITLLCCLASTSIAWDSAAGDVGPAMTNAATRFLASLSDETRAKATLKFDDPARLDWHNIPKATRKGVQVRDMNETQRGLCHALLRTALSESGYDKAVKIMSLENNLREGEKRLIGAPLRDPERYFLTIFGEPETSGEWGWSFEGHHFSLNFVIRDGEVVSATPSFWGANPATVRQFIPGGPKEGTRTLSQEEQLAFDLVASLNDSQRSKAVIADKAPAEYRGAGSPQPPRTAPEGLSVAEMSDAQKKTIAELLQSYSGHLAKPIAAKQWQKIESDGLNQLYFAWAGSTKPGVGHYYRVQGPSVLLELVNIQSDPAGNPANHIHSVWRSMEGDFGIPAN